MDLITRGCFMVGGRVKVTGSVSGTSSLSVPAGVTSITFTGHGGAGVYNAGTAAKFHGSNSTAVTTAVAGNTSTVGPIIGFTGPYEIAGYNTQQPTGQITFNASNSTAVVQVDIQGRAIEFSWSTNTTVAFSGGSGVYVTGNWLSSSNSGSTAIGLSLRTNLTYAAATSAYYSAGTSTTSYSAQSTNGTKTWASHASAGSPAAYQQTMTLSGAAATISYSVANGTTLSYEYFL